MNPAEAAGPEQGKAAFYTVGYQGWAPEELFQALAERDALLVDIRISPHSRNPAWEKTALERRLGERYVWLRAWGNENYRGGPVRIADWAAGLDWVRRQDQVLVLMCACRDLRRCHRGTVAQRLAEIGIRTEELPRPDGGPAGEQLELALD